MPTRSQTNIPPVTEVSLRSGGAVVILALALLARLFTVYFAISEHGAKWLYTRGLEMGFVARSLDTGRGFANPFGMDTGPTAMIAPGYPIMVAGIFRVFGIETSASAVVIMLLHVAASVLTVWFIMKFAGHCFGMRAAMIAGFFWAVWLPLLWVPTIFWETSFSACMMLALLMFAVRLREQPSRILWVLFGLYCGLASLINMAMLLSSLAVFLWLAFYHWRIWRTSLITALLLFALVYSPWPLRNARTFHAFIPLRTTVGFELWVGNQDNATGYLDESLFPIYDRQQLALYMREGELGYDKEKSAEGRMWIAAHPAQFAKLTTLRFLRFWRGTGIKNGASVYGLGATLTTIFGMLGLAFLYRSGRRGLTILFAIPFLLFPLPYYITHAEFRYRIVLDPILTVLAGGALARFTAKGREQADKLIEARA
ncbi:MAG TPA: glycosyltransferase family 39 protein [Acidobacteriaceae bacterium]|jgi:4-amino-4-deoxy-L-arabinose transferase-like glycosyltransferase